MGKLRLLLSTLAIAGLATPAFATSFVIGDNDGYGIGIPDGANHPFNGFTANFDGRSAAEMAATSGAQYTDTYSTTHPGFGPQPGTMATFTFDNLLANGHGPWTIGHLEIDAADFQASTFGAVITTFNGIVQPFNFNDGFPRTVVHHFDLSQAVLDSINTTGFLVITIDRNNSTDFYGFDYLSLNDFANPEETTPVPEPVTLLLLGAGLTMAGRMRRTQSLS
jgi:hypothetical protein